MDDTILISFSPSENIQKVLRKFYFLKKSNFFTTWSLAPFFTAILMRTKQ